MNIVIPPEKLTYDPTTAMAAAKERRARLYGTASKPVVIIPAAPPKPSLRRRKHNMTGSSGGRRALLPKVRPKPVEPHLTTDEIIAAVAAHWSVSVRDITGRRHAAVYIDARHHAIWRIWRDHPELGTIAIGHLFHRDHTTAVSAIARWDRLVQAREAPP